MIDASLLKIANDFVAEQANGLGYELETIERVNGHPSLWTVHGRWKSSGKGSIDAPPIIVFVDDHTLEASFLYIETDVLEKHGHLNE